MIFAEDQILKFSRFRRMFASKRVEAQPTCRAYEYKSKQESWCRLAARCHWRMKAVGAGLS